MGKTSARHRTLITAAGLALGAVLATTGLPAQAAVTGPLAKAVAQGKEIFLHDTFGGKGMSCAACHRAGGTGATVLPNGRRFPGLNNAAAIFPRFKARSGKVITLEDQIRGCVARGLHGKPPAYGSATMRSLVSYLTSLSQGKAIDMGGKPQ